MAGSRLYDFMYRFGLARALWSRVDRWEIRALVEGGPCDPARLAPATGGPARAIDLGCGGGGVSVYLAQQGFDTVGVDFSESALRLARVAAEQAGPDGLPLRFVRADLTASSIPGVEGPFDLLVDYGTLDDISAPRRHLVARLIDSLARPGSRFFLYAFYARRQDLPLFSLSGPSRLAPALDPGELESLFGTGWEIERLPRKGSWFIATFLLTKKSQGSREGSESSLAGEVHQDHRREDHEEADQLQEREDLEPGHPDS